MVTSSQNSRPDQQRDQCRMQAFHATIASFGHTYAHSASNSVVASNSVDASNSDDANTFTPESVQQMVLSALGIQVNSIISFPPSFSESGASNHMSGSLKILHNVHTYNDTQNIQIADSNTLPISVAGDINSYFRDVFVSPGLVSNLILVGQLVDNNCDVNSLVLVILCRITCQGK